MASKTVKFSMKSKVAHYYLTVGARDIPISNDKGSISLAVRSEDYILRWWMSGNPGTTLEITGQTGGQDVVKVKSKIPPGRAEAAGHKRFKVS